MEFVFGWSLSIDHSAPENLNVHTQAAGAQRMRKFSNYANTQIKISKLKGHMLPKTEPDVSVR